MTGHQEPLSILRTHLNQEPSREAFVQMMVFLRKWTSSEAVQVGIPYAQQHLEDWPDEIRRIRLLQIWPHFPAPPSPPSLRLVRELLISSHLESEQEANALAQTEALQYIKALTCHSQGPQAHWYISPEVIYSAENTQRLHILHTIATSPYLADLESLSFNSCGVLPGQIEKLLQDCHFTALKKLYLHGNQLRDEDALAIAQSKKLSLQKLDIAWNSISDAGITAIVQSPRMAQLQELRIYNNHTGEECIHAISNSPYMSRLQSIDMHEDLDWSPETDTRNRIFLNSTILSMDIKQRAFRGIRDNMSWRQEAQIHGITLPNGKVDASVIQQLKSLFLEQGEEPSTPRDRTQELDELLQQTPSERVYQNIQILFNNWQDEDSRHLGLLKAKKTLQDWHKDYLYDDTAIFWPSAPQGKPLPAKDFVHELPIEITSLLDYLNSPHIRHFPRICLYECDHDYTFNAEEIAQHPNLAHLKFIALEGIEYTVNDLKILGCSPHLSKLRELQLCHKLSNEHIEVLLSGEYFPGLQCLYLLPNAIQPEEKAKLHSSSKKLKVKMLH